MENISYNKRSITTIVVLSILTCGIYYLYWMYDTTRILSEFNDSHELNPNHVVLFTILTCGLYSLYWWYKITDVFVDSQELVNSSNVIDNKLILLLLWFFQLSIVSLAIFQSDLNNFWDSIEYRE